MGEGRSSHGITFIGKYIFVVGGKDGKWTVKRTCEKYDVTTDRS
jgi:hypothetical protein